MVAEDQALADDICRVGYDAETGHQGVQAHNLIVRPPRRRVRPGRRSSVTLVTTSGPVTSFILPYMLMQRFVDSRNTGALWAYGMLTSLILIWFGVIDGFMDHLMKALGFQNTTFLPGSEASIVKSAFLVWSPAAGNLFYVWTGIFTFIVGVFAVYFCYKFIQAQHPDTLALKTPTEGMEAFTKSNP